LIIKRQHSSVVGVHSYRGSDCDADNYLAVVKVRETVSRQRAIQRFDVERFNLKKLDNVEVKETVSG
jgi:hypothetical protein